jgi:hypothetical protein
MHYLALCVPRCVCGEGEGVCVGGVMALLCVAANDNLNPVSISLQNVCVFALSPVHSYLSKCLLGKDWVNHYYVYLLW